MTERTIIPMPAPVTQTIGAGRALACYMGIEEDLPGEIHLRDGVSLVLASKKR